LRYYRFGQIKTNFHFGQNENLSEMQSSIRQRLQRILAWIYALRIFDKRKTNGLYIKDLQEEGGRGKKTKNNLESPFGKTFKS
jgi:hypothetical protein